MIRLTSTHTAGPLEHSESPEVISRNHSLSYLQLGCQVLTCLSLILSKVIQVFFPYVPLEQTYQTSRSARLEKFLRNFNAGVRESLLFASFLVPSNHQFPMHTVIKAKWRRLFVTVQFSPGVLQDARCMLLKTLARAMFLTQVCS